MIEEAHGFVRVAAALCKSGFEIANVYFKLVAIRVEEIQRSAFTPILPPFDNLMLAQAFREHIELVGRDAEGIVSVILYLCSTALWIERQAQPEVTQRQIGAGTPRCVEPEPQHGTIKSDAAVDVEHRKRQVVQSR